MAAIPPICDFGWKAPDFTLPATDGKTYSLQDLMGEKGLVIAYICNHCPYVIAVKDRLIRDANDLSEIGIGFAGICANDAKNYPADSFEKMKQENYPFPYLHDESQETARAYDAVCTPDFFGFNNKLELQYRGRLDASKRDTAPEGTRRELYEAMKLVAETGAGPEDQTASMGCSIKWR